MGDVNQEVAHPFLAYVRKISHFGSAIALMGWDARTYMPKKGVGSRSEVMGTLSTEAFRLSVSEEMGRYIERILSQRDSFTPVVVRTAEECKRDYDRNRKLPPERVQEFVELTTTAESVWEEARSASDFPMFAPYLEKIVAMQREFVDLWGYAEHPYDALLDEYEPGATVGQLDALFSGLRTETVDLVRRIGDRPQIPHAFLERFFDPDRQRQFSEYILRQMGYDFEAGRLDQTAHPFATGIGRGDVRITTRYLANFFNSAIFGSIHEGGHALYEQNLGADLVNTPLYNGASMGIHESQSRFWENMIGRSHEFWECHYAKLQETFPESLGDVSLEEFYAAVNVVKPSLIRVEADELTYNLHIMIRYEIEKGLISGTTKVSDLPEIWREKTLDYLGIEPDSDANGVLQDVHWAGGSFGYFPSYSLGNLYAAQLRDALSRDMPDYPGLIRSGRLQPIREWLTQKIHRHGKMMAPAELIRQATGRTVDSTSLVQYLTEKFTSLYHLGS